MITNRVNKVKPSKTMEFSTKAKALKAQGISIMDFTAGEPDFDTPLFIQEAAINAMRAGHTRYTPVPGIPEVRKAIADKLRKDNHMEYSVNEICIGTGAKPPLFSAVFAVCQEGDEVIIPTPGWVSYEEIVNLCGGTPVFVPCREEDGFQLDMDAIRNAVTDKTKAILVNTPNNPTGAVYTRKSLEELVHLALEKHFYIISDEVYEKLVFEDARHISPGEICKEAKDCCVIINGLSKSHAMTGWRFGYAAANKEIANAIKSSLSHTTGSCNSITQQAALAALTSKSDCTEQMRVEYARRREFILERLKTIPYITCNPGTGAFYLMFNIKALLGGSYEGRVITSSGVLSELLLTEAHVGMMDGDAFFAPGFLRMCYAASMESIKEGMDRLEAFVRKVIVAE